MLRPVPNHGDANELASVDLVGIEPELASYLEQNLRRRWPHSVIRRLGPLDEASADLCIRTREPAAELLRPTLWLADVDRSHAAIRLAPNLWRSATPLTGRRLVRIIEGILRVVG